MGDQYVDNALMSPENMIFPSDFQPRLRSSDRVPAFGSDELISVASAISEAAYVTPQIQGEVDISNVIKAKIAFHPYYPRLLEAYIDCQKVKPTRITKRVLLLSLLFFAVSGANNTLKAAGFLKVFQSSFPSFFFPTLASLNMMLYNITVNVCRYFKGKI